MAILFADGFDHYTTPTQKGWSTNGCPIDAGAGRFGSPAMRITTSSTVLPIPGGSYSTLIMGLGFVGLADPAQTGLFMKLRDSGTEHIWLHLLSSGLFRISRAGTILGTGTIAVKVAAGVFNYLELKVTISDTVGVVQTWVNGIADLNLSSQDTMNGGNASVNEVFVHNAGGFASIFMDDFVLLDTSGSAPQNDRLGDVRVQGRMPNGNGNSSVLVGSDGNSTDNYLLVDEAAPNSDTDYVESSTVNDKDTYTYEDLTATAGTVYGVQILPFARKTDAGVRTIKSVARHSTNEVDGPDQTLPAGYIYLPDIRQTKPGGGAWTISELNASEFGAKVTA
jgi:hypothetical protein